MHLLTCLLLTGRKLFGDHGHYIGKTYNLFHLPGGSRLLLQYVARSHTLLYLAIEFSVTRCKISLECRNQFMLIQILLVYANSILAM